MDAFFRSDCGIAPEFFGSTGEKAKVSGNMSGKLPAKRWTIGIRGVILNRLAPLSGAASHPSSASFASVTSRLRCARS